MPGDLVPFISGVEGACGLGFEPPVMERVSPRVCLCFRDAEVLWACLLSIPSPQSGGPAPKTYSSIHVSLSKAELRLSYEEISLTAAIQTKQGSEQRNRTPLPIL